MATINNPTDEERQFILSVEAKEVVADEEVGEEETPHIHCYIHWATEKRLSQLKKLLPRAHWDPVRNQVESRNYCRKGKVLRDTGVAGRKTQSHQTRELVEIACTQGLKQALETDQYLFHRSRRLIVEAWSCSQLCQDYQKPSVVWLYGGSGVGKTRYVVDQEKDNLSILYCDSPLWFDAYKQWYDAVLLDDFRADVLVLHKLLQILDRYPIQVPIKGGFTAWRPKRIYVTTPMHPREVYKNVPEENIQQLLRRIDKIIHCVSLTAQTSTLPSLDCDAVLSFSQDGSWQVGTTPSPERFPLPSGIPLLPEPPLLEFNYHSTQTESGQTE